MLGAAARRAGAQQPTAAPRPDTAVVLGTVYDTLSGAPLRRKVRGRDTAAFTIRGIAAHDLYHAGQIQLLRRLQKVK